MGGRGSSGSGAGSGVFGKEKPIEVSAEKSMSSGNRWKRRILSASDNGRGNISLSYPDNGQYEKLNNNTTKVTYSLNQGVYDRSNSGYLASHNINWDKVKSVSGNTFEIKDYIKKMGFKWDSRTKSWIR